MEAALILAGVALIVGYWIGRVEADWKTLARERDRRERLLEMKTRLDEALQVGQ
jgi:hypothetical protein